MKSSKTTIDHPEGIILRILSFLPITTSLQTSTIARKWCNQSLPFRFHPRFLHVRLLLQLSGQISIWDIRQLFSEFISRMLLQCHRHSPLEKFHLLFFDYVIYDSMMMRSYVNSIYYSSNLTLILTWLAVYLLSRFKNMLRMAGPLRMQMMINIFIRIFIFLTLYYLVVFVKFVYSQNNSQFLTY